MIPFRDVLTALLEEIVIERIMLADEIAAANPKVHAWIKTATDGAVVDMVNHEQFKILCNDVKGIIRTGECTPYANVILQSGVNFS
jgi:D-ribose pyranase